MAGYIERRRGPRAPLDGVATVQQHGRESLACELHDVSTGGMAVLGSVPAPEGFVRISFRLGEQSSRFDVDGLVVREESRGGAALWGVRFLGLDPGTRTRLHSYIRGATNPVPAAAG